MVSEIESKVQRRFALRYGHNTCIVEFEDGRFRFGNNWSHDQWIPLEVLFAAKRAFDTVYDIESVGEFRVAKTAWTVLTVSGVEYLVKACRYASEYADTSLFYVSVSHPTAESPFFTITNEAMSQPKTVGEKVRTQSEEVWDLLKMLLDEIGGNSED